MNAMNAENSAPAVDFRRAVAEGAVTAALFGIPMGFASGNLWASLLIGLSVGVSMGFSVAFE